MPPVCTQAVCLSYEGQAGTYSLILSGDLYVFKHIGVHLPIQNQYIKVDASVRVCLHMCVCVVCVSLGCKALDNTSFL